jgi:hypothetical protein
MRLSNGHPQFKLTLTPDDGMKLEAWCLDQGLGGTRHLPQPELLLDIARDLDMVTDHPENVQELLRRLASKIQQRKPGSRSVQQDQPWQTGSIGELVTATLDLWYATDYRRQKSAGKKPVVNAPPPNVWQKSSSMPAQVHVGATTTPTAKKHKSPPSRSRHVTTSTSPGPSKKSPPSAAPHATTMNSTIVASTSAAGAASEMRRGRRHICELAKRYKELQEQEQLLEASEAGLCRELERLGVTVNVE